MHTDLSAHLHSDKCNDLIQLLQKCHDEHPFRKFLGYCNHEDAEMLRCLKQERLARRDQNRIKSEEMKKRWRMNAEERAKREKENAEKQM